MTMAFIILSIIVADVSVIRVGFNIVGTRYSNIADTSFYLVYIMKINF